MAFLGERPGVGAIIGKGIIRLSLIAIDRRLLGMVQRLSSDETKNGREGKVDAA